MLELIKPRPHLRRVLKGLDLPLDRVEYETLLHAGLITINEQPIVEDRLDDGIHIVQVDGFGNIAKFWVEVLNKKVVRGYIM